MGPHLFENAMARLQHGDAAGARELMRRAAGAEPRAAVVYTNFIAAGFGGPRDWPGALRLLPALAAGGGRWAHEVAILEQMALTPDGDPTSLPPAEKVSERPHVRLFRGVFNERECAYLRMAATPMLSRSVVVDPVSGVQRPDPLRTSHAAGFNAPLECPAVHALNRRLAAASGTAPEQGEPLQVLRYAAGGEYRAHLDAIPGFANQRVMTMLVWLNDDYEGGETHFPEADLTLRGAAGDAILFRNTLADGSADPLSRHAGLPVASGEKWLASRWIRERPFDYFAPR